jgi:hypothetical protein
MASYGVVGGGAARDKVKPSLLFSCYINTFQFIS